MRLTGTDESHGARRRIRRGLLGTLGVLFGWAAYLQLNDPAPALWVVIYGYAALVAGAGAAGWRCPKQWLGASATVALAGAGYLAFEIFWLTSATPMYEPADGGEVGLLATKEGREMFGLLIVAASFGLQLVSGSTRENATDSG